MICHHHLCNLLNKILQATLNIYFYYINKIQFCSHLCDWSCPHHIHFIQIKQIKEPNDSHRIIYCKVSSLLNQLLKLYKVNKVHFLTFKKLSEVLLCKRTKIRD